MDGDVSEVSQFVNWLSGKEADATHGAVARYVQDNITRRPASGTDVKWRSFDDIRSAFTYYGNVSVADLNAVVEAFRAS